MGREVAAELGVQTVQLLTRGRLPDRYFLTTVRQPEPGEEEGGTLAAVLEFRLPWFPASEIAQAITKTLIKTFEESPLDRPAAFEEALRATNEVLAQKTEEGKTEWIGKLAGGILLVTDSEVFFTGVGDIGAYLFRESNVVALSQGEEPAVHPLRTFQSLVSGRISEDDRLLLATGGLFQKISMDSLRELFRRASLTQIASELAKDLRRERVREVNAVLLELTRTSEPLYPEYVYLDAPPRLEWLERGEALLERAGGLLGKLTARFGPSLKLLRPYLNQLVVQVGKGTIQAGEFLGQLASRLARKTGYTRRFRGSVAALERSLERGLDPLRSRRQLVLTILILVAVFLALTLTLASAKRRTRERMEREAATIFREVREMIREAELTQLRGKREEARALFAAALERLAKAVPQSAGGKEEGGRLRSQVQAALDQANRIVRVKPQVLIDFREAEPRIEPATLFVIEKTAYTVDRRTLAIFRERERLTNLPQSSGQYRAASANLGAELLLFWQEPEGLYEFGIRSGQVSRAAVAFQEAWEGNVAAIASFGANIYLLDPVEGQIWKHTKTQAGYSKKVPYLRESVDLRGARSLTVDGSVWVLQKDGSVVKLTLGRREEFSLQGLPKPLDRLEDATKIVTEEAARSIFILDGAANRIVEFDKTGQYSRQFIFEEAAGKISDFVITIKGKKLYALAGTKVYEVNL